MTENTSATAQPQFTRWSLALYSGLLYLFTPLILLYFWRQGRRNPAYRARLAERFGKHKIPDRYCGGVVFHCVSVGEFFGSTSNDPTFYTTPPAIHQSSLQA